MKRVWAVVLLVAAAAAAFASGDGEQGPRPLAAGARWQDRYPTVVYSVISSENEADRVVRYKPVIDYLQRELGVKVDFFTASDYAGTIEAQKAGKVHFAGYGTASYVRAWMVTGGGVEPLVAHIDATGSSGYHSVVAVRSDSAYRSLDDLKGRSLAFADPNSTSGFVVPSFYLRKAGKDPDTFFGRTGFAGNHEMGVIAVIQGTYDACATHWTNESAGNIQRMASKGMIKADDLRIIWTSPIITNGPIAAIRSLPEKMKEDFKQAFLQMRSRAPEVYDALQAPTPGKGYIEVTHERYADFLEMTKLNDEQQRKRQ